MAIEEKLNYEQNRCIRPGLLNLGVCVCLVIQIVHVYWKEHCERRVPCSAQVLTYAMLTLSESCSLGWEH